MTETRAVRRFLEHRSARVGVVLVGALVVFAVVGPAFAPDPDTSDFAGVSRHWLGVDPIRRDVLARLAHGARVSLGIATAATLLTTAVGLVIGLAAGLSAGRRWSVVDAVLMRTLDVMLAMPFLLFVTAIGAAVGRAELGTILLVLGLTGWTGVARVVRDRTVVLREQAFVEASRALGAGVVRIAARHIVPNLSGTLLVLATASVGQMILAEAVLGYLTVGLQPPEASWGRMLHESEPFLGTRPALLAAPGLAIVLAVLGFARIGEGLRDVFDPRSSARPGRDLPVDLLVAFAALALLAVPGPSDVAPPLGHPATNAARPVRGGVLRLATLVNIRTLEPALAYDEVSGSIESLLFARLVTWDGRGNVVPDLARSIAVNDDATTYTFELRPDVVFHDGARLTAADVKRSIERMLSPKTPCPAASHYGMIKGFAAFRAGRAEHLEGVRVVGDRTVAIDLDHPDATFLPLMTLAFAAPVCPSSGTRVDPRAPTPPCGAGPMRLASWEPDRGVELVRHEGYFVPGLPYLDGVTWLTNVRPSTQRYKFEAGELDMLRDLAPTDSERYRAEPSWHATSAWAPRLATYGVFLNTELAPFDDVHLRRAVAFALDPSALVAVRSDIAPADRILPAAIPGPDRAAAMRTHDVARALDEMALAGVAFDPSTGRGGYPHPIDYLAVTESFDQQAGEIWQQQLARIGIRLRLRLVAYATYLAESQRRRTSRMGATGWNADFPDAANFFEPILATPAIQEEGSENTSFFSNAELDHVLVHAHRSLVGAERLADYARAETIVRDRAPWIPLYTTRTFEVWHAYLHGYAPHPILPQHVERVWLDPDRARAPALRSPMRSTP